MLVDSIPLTPRARLAFAEGERIGERQLPVEENGDELKNTGAKQALGAVRKAPS
jgi:hypothetical protein